MVFFFYPRGYDDGKASGKPEANLIYMGRDKYENEELIKYGAYLCGCWVCMERGSQAVWQRAVHVRGCACARAVAVCGGGCVELSSVQRRSRRRSGGDRGGLAQGGPQNGCALP